MSGMEYLIKSFCNRTGSQFVGYKDGLYKFMLVTGKEKGLTQTELRKIVRNF